MKQTLQEDQVPSCAFPSGLVLINVEAPPANPVQVKQFNSIEWTSPSSFQVNLVSGNSSFFCTPPPFVAQRVGTVFVAKAVAAAEFTLPAPQVTVEYVPAAAILAAPSNVIIVEPSSGTGGGGPTKA